jgi:intein/homing endonuclease
LKACLTGDNYLLLLNNISKKIKDVVAGDIVESPLGPTKVLENKPILKECMIVELDDGRIIKGSKDHRIWTSRGWVELQRLRDDDEVL